MVKAMIMLDSEGKRITVKYYTKEWASSVKEQSNFERSLFVKTARTNARGEGKRLRKQASVSSKWVSLPCLCRSAHAQKTFCFLRVGNPRDVHLRPDE